MVAAAVILNWNGAQMSAAAARSVRDFVERIYLVDNGSAPDDLGALREAAEETGAVVVNLGRNFGFAAGMNQGIRVALAAGFDELLIMNSDTEAAPGAVGKLRGSLATRPEVAAVAPVQLTSDAKSVIHSTVDVSPRTGSITFADQGQPPESLPSAVKRSEYLCGTAILFRARARGVRPVRRRLRRVLRGFRVEPTRTSSGLGARGRM